jgi:hypothetical protein
MKNHSASYVSRVRAILTVCLAALPLIAPAQPSAHYVPGVEGLKGATLPPPGVYLRDYNVLYLSDRLNDSHGNAVPGVDPKATVYANVPRVVWITEKQLLGGYLGVDGLLPFKYTDLDISAGPNKLIDSHTFGVGDFFAEGSWSKHIERFDFSLAAGVWAPTGDSAPGLTTRAGLGYWTEMFTAGATWYVDPQKRLAVSALNRYEINQEKEDTDITPGQAYTLEWGISYAYTKTIDLGVVGYYQEQVTEDSGQGSSSARDRVAGVGPEVSVFYPEIMLGWSLRYVYEFMAESRLQGNTFALTITKRF